jgi:O-antigen biosynthesis protein
MIDYKPKISVIIPSYNSMHTIEKCLDSVINQSINLPYEIIVVDSSNDKTPEIMQSYLSMVRYFHLAKKTIPAIARNIGVEKAAGEYVAFTDSDCVVASTWLEEVMKAHQSGYQVVCGSIANYRPRNIVSIAEYFLEFREFSERSPKRLINYFPSCNFSIKSHLFKKIGGFPDIRASEDMFLGYNLTKAGIQILFQPEINIKHMNRYRLKDMLKNQLILGVGAAVVRKILNRPGSFLVKHHGYAVLIPFIKLIRTIQIISRDKFPYNLYQYLNLILSLPIFTIGSVAYSIGFGRGVRNGALTHFKKPIPE